MQLLGAEKSSASIAASRCDQNLLLTITGGLGIQLSTRQIHSFPALTVKTVFPKMTLSPDELFRTTEAMQRFGGNFAHYLALTIRYADSDNKQKLLSTFPEIIERYGPQTYFYASIILDNDGKV